MTQQVIVGVILVATAVFAVRWLVRSLRGKGGCTCHGCPHCPASDGKECHCGTCSPHLPDIKV